jgi:hypothetical protein
MTALLGTGFFANVASGAISGVFAGQYDRLASLVLAGQINQIRSTLFRPQDLVLDGVLGGIGGGVGYGINSLIEKEIQNEIGSNLSRVTNSNGRLGGPSHQAEVAKITDGLKINDYITEFKVNTPGGAKPYRFVDVAYIDSNGDPTVFFQVGKITKGNLPVMRERNAISDIAEFSGIDIPIYFIPYW